MISDIMWAMEEQHITMTVILDLFVAFDMLDHNILLKSWKANLGNIYSTEMV